jgi:hypothetical protein
VELRKHLPLPEGYRVDEVEGYLRLFSPHGILLQEEAHGPGTEATLEARAWRDAWEQIERELKEELHALREGIRPLHELRRLRQYMRMLDAMNGAPGMPAGAQERPNRTGAVAWLALAASAAAIVMVVMTTPLRVAQTPEAPQAASPSVGLSAPAATPEPGRRAAPPAPVPGGATRPVGISSQPAGPVRTAGPAAGQPAMRGYAVTFGEFAGYAAAEINMHLIRGKGYLVYVTRIGDSFQVATRPYRTRAQAERLANALQEIGLPARMKKAETPAL